MDAREQAVVDALNHLIGICRDGEEGFAAAGEALQNLLLREELRKISAERARFYLRLQCFVEEYGARAEEAQTPAGLFQQGWVQLKSLLTSGDEAAILEECIKIEQRAAEHYREAILKDLPLKIANVCREQLNRSEATLKLLQGARTLFGA